MLNTFIGSFDKYGFGNGKNKFKNVVVKKVMQKAFDVSDKLIFISKAVEKTFIETFKINNKNKVVVYNGINKVFFENVSEDRTQNIIYVGRLAKEKGLDVFLKALKKVYEKNSKVKTTIVGDGEEREKLEKMANELGIQNNVEFVGRQSEVKNWLDNNMVFVYPSICGEGFGISVAEAMARGCIPVTFRVGGLPELINNEENGFLVDEISEESLSNKILDILNLPQNEIERLRKNAIQTSKVFSVDNTIKNLKIEFTSL